MQHATKRKGRRTHTNRTSQSLVWPSFGLRARASKSLTRATIDARQLRFPPRPSPRHPAKLHPVRPPSSEISQLSITKRLRSNNGLVTPDESDSETTTILDISCHPKLPVHAILCRAAIPLAGASSAPTAGDSNIHVNHQRHKPLSHYRGRLPSPLFDSLRRIGVPGKARTRAAAADFREIRRGQSSGPRAQSRTLSRITAGL